MKTDYHLRGEPWGEGGANACSRASGDATLTGGVCPVRFLLEQWLKNPQLVALPVILQCRVLGFAKFLGLSTKP